ncbi:hypothetical protein DsansV1_C10g0101101 [Dioscorea sansibarensis]
MAAAAKRLAISSRIASKTGFVELCNGTNGSKFRCFGNASAASGALKEQKELKKISKLERRAMLEAFVDQYRASNAGRFPTVSFAQKQIGGSYYHVRQIIKELEFNHRMSLLGKNRDGQVGKTEVGSNPSLRLKEVPGPSEIEEVSKPVASASCLSHKDIDTGSEIGSEDSAIVDLAINDELLDRKKPPVSSTVVTASPPVSSTVVTASVKRAVKNAHSSSRKKIVKCTKNSSINGVSSSGTQMGTDESSIDSMSGLSGESLQRSDHDSKRDEANLSVSSRLETTVHILNSSHPNSQENTVDLKSTGHLHDRNEPQRIDQIGSLEAPESEALIGDPHKNVEIKKSSPARSDIWGNLKALANSFVNFWRKK